MPYTTLTPGTTITSSWGNASVRDQTVTPFATAAARASAVTSPLEGMLGYRVDGKTFEGYDGVSYVRVPFVVHANKTADETVNNSAALQNDDALAWAVAGSATYAFRLYLVYSSGTTPDLKFTFTGPASFTMSYTVTGFDTSGSFAFGNISTESSTPTLGGTGGNVAALITGRVVTAATAGTLQLQWAQNTANGSDTIVRAGSHGVLTRLT